MSSRVKRIIITLIKSLFVLTSLILVGEIFVTIFICCYINSPSAEKSEVIRIICIILYEILFSLFIIIQIFSLFGLIKILKSKEALQRYLYFVKLFIFYQFLLNLLNYGIITLAHEIISSGCGVDRHKHRLEVYEKVANGFRNLLIISFTNKILIFCLAKFLILQM